MKYGNLISSLHFFSLVIPFLLNTAFVTLLERKLLASSQHRLGPNKVGFIGVLQPFADAVKLFSKQYSYVTFSFTGMYFFTPVLALTLSLVFLMSLPLMLGNFEIQFTFMFMMVILSLNVYPVLLGGWASNTLYSFMGAIRSAAQTISYEISLALILLSIISISVFTSLNLSLEWASQSKLYFFPIWILWLITVVAELNRTPFDFAEGESELVSGFNVEYSATKFALYFMAEYMSIISMSTITAILCFQTKFGEYETTMVSLAVSAFIVWLRAALPRYRYDLLMILAWKTLLPLSLTFVQYLFILGAVIIL